MADVLIDKYRVKVVRQGTTPANPGNVSTDPLSPVNPGGGGGTFFGVGAGLSLDFDNKVQFGKAEDSESQYVDLMEFFPTGNKSFYLSTDFRSYWDGTGDPHCTFYLFQSASSVQYLIEANYNGFSYASILQDSNSTDSIINLISAKDDSGVSKSMSILLDTSNLMLVSDGVNSKGLEEDSDYSANKTDNSYITPNWLKYQTGYNASVAQYFTHDGAGNFEWIDI